MDNIMIRVAEGDRKAFDKLFFMYYPKVRNYLFHFIPSKEQTEDLAQDFFIKLWNNRINLSAIKNPDSYFFVSSKNMALNYLKKVKHCQVDIDRFPDIPSAMTADKDYEAFEAELVMKLLVDKLPEERRRIFCMSRFDGLTNSEIAQKLGISKKTVENQIYRALKELKKHSFYIFLLLLWVQQP